MRINKSTSLSALLVILSLAACSMLPTSLNPSASTPNPAATPNPADTAEVSPTATSAPAMVLAVKEAHSETSEIPKLKVDARWPFLQWSGDPRADAFNKAAEDFVNNEINTFRDGLTQNPADPSIQDQLSAIDINFTTVNENNGVLSVLFRVYYYVAGAAHPGHTSHTLNYDLRQGKILELDSLLKPGYLDFLSQTCMADLKKRDVLTWEDGALPKAENFKSWNITPDGILITFDEYQVTPYAMGAQTVMIPYSQLKEEALPDTILASFLK